MKFTDFSLSHKYLCSLTKSILADSHIIGFEKSASPDFYTEDSKLFINLGLSQGWVVVDALSNTVHHVSDVDDMLTDNNLCNNYLAQLLYQDISDFLVAILEELGLTDDDEFFQQPINSLPL